MLTIFTSFNESYNLVRTGGNWAK